MPTIEIKETPSFVVPYGYDNTFQCKKYTIDPAKLPKDEVHLFYLAAQLGDEHLIATALEFFTFHPETKNNNKFNMHVITPCGSLKLIWCHFPKEFRSVCERAAAAFDMLLSPKSRSMVTGGEGTESVMFVLPRSENILLFAKNDRSASNRVIASKAREIQELGNLFEKLGVD